MFNAECFTKSYLVSVALTVPIGKKNELVYRVPDTLRPHIQVGVRVVVPVTSRKITGIIAKLDVQTDRIDNEKLKDILDVIDEVPVFTENMRDISEWMSAYYFSTQAAALQAILPRPARNQSSLIVTLPKKRKSKKKKTASGTTGTGIEQDSYGHQSLPAHASGALSSAEADILKYVTAKKRVAVRSLQHRLPRKILKETLEQLEARNLITVTESFPRPRPEHVRAAAAEHTEFCTESLQDTQASPRLLTSAQQIACSHIEKAIDSNRFDVFLLHGVTGSGKTEVYLNAADYAGRHGKSVIFLVPEIALTHQLVLQARCRFGDRVGVLHSAMTGKQRWEEWQRIAKQEAAVVVGARSAVFSPVVNLGLIVVDEEHDSAYKQEDGIRYNARDVAVVRGKLAACQVVLGSATPALESYAHAKTGRYTGLSLPERVAERPLPKVEVIDLRREFGTDGTTPIFSSRLETALATNYEAGKQSLLFLNRRGYANYLQCRACGEAVSCPHCSVSLTLHRRQGELCCHYCGFTRRPGRLCPACREPALDGMGIGTEQVESALARLLPRARIARLDRDTVRRRGSLDRLLRAWRAHEFDVLVGTQLVTKGHDVPGVTLVGVILADVSLNRPDFRAAERTFQLLTQVAGRAGRGHDLGTVIVQTYSPRHYSILCAARHDYARFAAQEQRYRKQLGYPPFTRLINLRFEGREVERVETAAKLFADQLNGLLESEEFESAGGRRPRVLGPAPAPIERIKGRARWQLLVKGSHRQLAHDVVGRARDAFEGANPPRGVRLIVDVDPYSVV